MGRRGEGVSQIPGEYIKTTTVPDGIFPEKQSLIGAAIDEVFSFVLTYRQTDGCTNEQILFYFILQKF